MSLRSLAEYRARRGNKTKRQVRVPFTKWQYDTVHAFLNGLRDSGKVEAELGAPIKVEVDWSHENQEKAPHVYLQGSRAYKTIFLKDILEAAADAEAKANATPPEKNDERN